ncbi:MAG: tail fiber domain-containing protein [Bacteroidota bacterium]
MKLKLLAFVAALTFSLSNSNLFAQGWVGTTPNSIRAVDAAGNVDKVNVGIGIANPDPNAILDLTAKDKGLLIPRVKLSKTNQTSPFSTAPTTSLLVYNFASTGGVFGVTPGFYYWNGTLWEKLGAGVVGPTGPTGDQGIAGINGINGLNGATGATGEQGLPGINGTNGLNGATGATGEQGIAGVNGTNGLNGATGATGEQGLPGINGTNGLNGVTGPTGEQGIAGVNGTNGLNGATGATGFLQNGATAGNTPFWNGTNWVTNSSNIFNNGGNVGIGNSTPAEKLDVIGNISFSGAIMPNGLAGSVGQVLVSNGTGMSPTWEPISTDFWGLNGNVGTNSSSNFIGTTDEQAFTIRTNNIPRTRITTKGQIEVLNTGQSVFIGEEAGLNDDLLLRKNVFVGTSAGRSNTSGEFNTGNGYQALYSNTTGYGNTATGTRALASNTTGIENVASGYYALRYNTTGNSNMAYGSWSLYSNTTGYGNSTIGSSVLFYNSTGYYNTGGGIHALRYNTEGYLNTALGVNALFQNTTGNYNTALGANAFLSGATYSNSTALGYATAITASNQVRVGNANVTSIGGQVGWTTVSDARFKKDIHETVPGLAFILKLRPVTYHLDVDNIEKFLKTPDSLRKKELEVIKSKMLQTGFIAQEVESAAQEIGYDFSGVDKPKNENDYYGLRYAEFTVPLIKAVQEQQEIINDLQARLNDLEMNSTKLDNSTDVKEVSRLSQNTPNPFNQNTSIDYFVAEGANNAVMYIYSMQGQQIKKYFLDQKGKGTVIINSKDLVAGIYHYSLIVDGKLIDTKKMILTQ